MECSKFEINSKPPTLSVVLGATLVVVYYYYTRQIISELILSKVPNR